MPKTSSKISIIKRNLVYAFIDSQNLNLGTKKDLYSKSGRKIYSGWKLDFRNFRVYLADKFRVKKAFLFIGYVPGNEPLYSSLESCGYDLVFKETIKDRTGKTKGNVDAELVLHAAKLQFYDYDKAVIVSGDGDFCCLYKHLTENRKLYKIIIPNLQSQSSLLEAFKKYKVYIINEKNWLELKKGQ